MDAPLWQTVQQVFADALDVPEDDRAAHLARVCASQPELLAEVSSLLASHARAGAFIEPVPDRVGPYRIVAAIGSGGMGAVYRARRDDGRFEQEVAVKLLHLPAGPTQHRRFLDEQQILANLSHPNIARLLDGGITRSGIPYLVMEYIDGVPLDRYCEGRPLAERLALFRTVCAAAHYAHQHLVVHRDLKPGNVLVTRDGELKLLDFGIAKILDHDTRSSRITVVPWMTPEYASPEQLRGDPISTASDVYSLGVLLQEIVTGRRPFDLSGKSFSDVVRLACDQPPPRAQTGSADLDAIVAKALRADPADRYASAEALATDVGRYLAKRPVEARQGAWWYLFTRLVVRHRLAAIAAAVVALVLGGAVAVTVRESRIAARRFQDVRRLASSVVFEIHDSVAALPGSTAARRLIIDSVVEHLDTLAQDADGDRALQIELAEGYLRLADAQGFHPEANLGDPTSAIASYHKSRELFSVVLRRTPTDARATLGAAEASRHLALVYGFIRQPDDARRVCAEAIVWLEGLVAREPTDLHRRRLASAYSSMSDVWDNRVDYRQKALDIVEELLAREPQSAALQRDVALAHKTMAATMLIRSAGDQALPHLARAEALDRARVAANPTDREALLDLSFDHSQNATFHLNRSRFNEALESFERALDTRRGLATLDPADARLQDRLAYAYERVGFTSLLLSQSLRARGAYEEAERIHRRQHIADPAHPQYRANLAFVLVGRGQAEKALGRGRDACEAWQAASALYDALRRENKLTRVDQDRIGRVTDLLLACPR